MEILHHSIYGVHHPAGMVPKLAAPLHLLGILHVLELAEVLFRWWEVDEEPEREREMLFKNALQYSNRLKYHWIGWNVS